jgi:hypothetical protein
MTQNIAAAAAIAAVLGVGPYQAEFQTPELKKELSLLRRQIRTGASDARIVETIRRITALRLRAKRASGWTLRSPVSRAEGSSALETVPSTPS